MANSAKRRNATVRRTLYDAAKARSEERGASFTTDLADLIRAYADGVFAIDPREIPDTSPDRPVGGVAIFPHTAEDWENAGKRAAREHGISRSAMLECILERYHRGQIRIERTVTITEVQPIRRNLLNSEQRAPQKAYTIPDATWDIVGPLLPQPQAASTRNIDTRDVLEVIALKFRDDIAWGSLPADRGAWRTFHGRYMRWHEAGTFETLRDKAGHLEGMEWLAQVPPPKAAKAS